MLIYILRSICYVLDRVVHTIENIKGKKLTEDQVDTIIKSSQIEIVELMDDSQYNKLGTAVRGDWLYKNYREKGQTVEQYIQSNYNYVTDSKKKIYVLPIIDNKKTSEYNYDKIIEYISIFFQLETILLDTIDINTLHSTFKDSKINLKNLFKDDQYDTQTILEMLKHILPTDAFCLLALTNVDLCSKGCNFVFGEASYNSRIGIASVCRFDPLFYQNNYSQEDFDELSKYYGYNYEESLVKDKLINRIYKIVTHEILHMFSMDHCIWYNCNMCGINGINELDKYSYRLCPICINKLYIANKFDVKKRTSDLEYFYKHNNIVIN